MAVIIVLTALQSCIKYYDKPVQPQEDVEVINSEKDLEVPKRINTVVFEFDKLV